LEERRIGHFMDFRQYIVKNKLKKQDRILEFGPLTRPTVTKKTHPNIRFADIRSSEEIKKLYTSNDYLESTGISVDLNSIVDIDYVVSGSYKDSFKGVEKFDKVILSHVIEHMPDIIFFFEDVMNLLKENGQLILIYPDARYCFDHFRNGTTFVDAYDVYRHTSNSSKRVLDFVFNVVHENNPNYFWGNPRQNNILPKNDFDDALMAYNKASKNELPDDTHFWPFADYQLVKFLYDLDRAGFLGLELLEFYPTQENTQEFMLVLTPKKKKTINFSQYKKLLNKIHPSVKEIKARAQIEKLQGMIATLKAENESLNAENGEFKNELAAIYTSKKWKYATKAGEIKSAIVGRNDEKV
jgi:hypothetical protein